MKIKETNKKINIGGSLRDYKKIVAEDEKKIYCAHYIDGKFITAITGEKLERNENKKMLPAAERIQPCRYNTLEREKR